MTNVPGLKVTLQFEFDYDEPVGPQVAAVQQLVSALVQERATVAVAIEDATPPANPVPPKRRGRPPILPQGPPVDASPEPLVAAGNGTGTSAEDLMTPPATKAKPGANILDDTEDDDAADPFGLPSAGRTGKEALEQALGILRNIFNAKHRPLVKEIQTEMGIAQFSDVEAKDGHKLLKLAEQAAQKVGMRV